MSRERPKIDPYRLTEAERRAYANGEWFGVVPSAELQASVTEIEAVAELAARVRLICEHGPPPKEAV